MTLGTHTDIYTRRESQARSYCRAFPVSFSKAQNATLTDSDGRNYTDFLAGCSSLNYGHNDPDMKEALIAHITRDGVTHGLDMHTDAKAEFLDAFERLILKPRDMDYKFMFTGPTGTNAVEAAMKLARKTTGRDTIIAFTNGFHGMTMGALAATGNAGKRAGAGTTLSGVVRMPYEGAMEGVDSLAMIRAMLDNPSSGIDAPAAFLIEPVQGEGGLNAASSAFLKGLQTLAREHGALIIMDDIQAGIGRTGPFFSFEGMGIKPDLIPLAKSLSGMGLPMAGLLIRPDLDVWKPAEHNGTFRGNNHAFVTARVALEKFWSDDRFQRQTEAKAAFLTERLKEIAALVPGAGLKGRGMMQGIDVGSGDMAADICATCFEHGLIIETSGAHDEVVKVLAPLTIPQEQLASGLDILEAAVKAQSASHKIAAE
ncbi:diaminobutyrate--2-oxoglutarate transaminase [Roseinatronobacter bogoriensis]|uniref:Diaminobutyrate--2-oxoglutarate transaminase n=1 Tax=Roseinatronobacter bogoriensis subsp. barguzinensis TaxID=441209 RepID=A0A2K8KAW0_9RHOB|nr:MULTISPECIES: diaminobutyrate--2-oxoglutarate transaminase [Rhodobaca]ATX66116.1 diaminobutyrate--2-oxoglutarate transaminase [Rhodobaca barguzinensis]MBB4207143.1 diaminobutyrate-2-oxoglutarate transaminase [Rhodobaca bogoriensis DSM 18756]TDW40487.1 diaminobutyrate aminotransferase [Rhodobaca barguzinensis]TDY70361.1 diaminobutyrate aminotransferase [Rhodobaca bogoriensis DSM 18756]